MLCPSEDPMIRKWIGVNGIGMIWVAVCLIPNTARSEDSCHQEIGRFVSVQGTVEILRPAKMEWKAVTLDTGICPGDQTRVGPVSRAALVFLNSDTVLNLDQNTNVEISEPPEEEFSFLRLFRGVVHFFSRKPRALEVQTPYVNAAVQGTEFLVRVDEKEAFISVFEGEVSATNEFGSLKIVSDQAAVARVDQAPLSVVVVRPRDAVQWALYYPRLFAALPRGLPADLVLAGDLLGVGRVDEARRALDTIPNTSPVAGIKFAFLAVIAVAQNNKEEALTEGRKAVEQAPRSSAAKIALSYALQANFNLEAARDILLQAVEDESRDALAWARLAELWLSLGYLDRATGAAEKAQSLSPDLERINTVLGFVNLARIKVADAKAAFRTAIELDDRAPLPRLGLGLAEIRDGDLDKGGREIEIAALLDPANSLIRSYLGKAYFEEHRGPLSAREFAEAKRLDPRDPTPWFYDAIRKQSENRPVEALGDIQKSIELNDNRAVYRSRLLLDRDRAARGASLARIYDDLGFQQLGVNVATKSLTSDPTNPAAHRFLSDTYRSVRRRETARVSELLQAQLLQDINVNPVQPRLSETNLNIIGRGGPTEAGLNEFTPLFERNQIQFNATGESGDDSTLGGEGVVSAIYDRFSVSAGAFHFETDGWRNNYDIEHDIYNFFAQAAITPDFNVQAEFRSRHSKAGDLALNFDPGQFLDMSERTIDQDIARAGLRYSPTPSSDILLSFIYTDRNENLSETSPLGSLDFVADAKADDQGRQVEAQYLFGSDRFNVVTGFGYTDVDREVKVAATLGGFPIISVNTEPDIEHPRGYIYANLNFPDPITWTLGATYDDYKREGLQVEKVSPKFGIRWDVTQNVQVRGAAFQTVKPALVSNRTIEPTQIAGFNQFFDDSNAAKSTRYGVGLDWDMTPQLSVGVEATWRHLEDPVFSGGVANFEDRDEELHRAYLYWTPFAEAAVSGEFIYDLYETNESSDDDLPRKVETIRVPVGVRYFHHSGLFAAVGVTYVYQQVERSELSSLAEGKDNFFVTDAAVGWRIPNRRGIVSLEMRNLFDQRFDYQDDSFREFSDEPSTGPFIPGRTILGRLTLNF